MPGIFVLAGMSLQFPPGAIVASIGPDGTSRMDVTQTLVRIDLWPTWVEIGCIHTEQAWAASQGLSPDLADDDKFTILTEELQAGLVAISSFGFAFDGFYDTVKAELGPHPDEAKWKQNRTAREAQVTETLRYHLKLGQTFSAQLRQLLEQLFDFRARGVHPTSKYVEPNFRPQIDSGVHPHLITFSGPHAVQARALALEILSRLVDRASDLSKPGADIGWLNRGRTELVRLSGRYRMAGDDVLAFPPTPLE